MVVSGLGLDMVGVVLGVANNVQPHPLSVLGLVQETLSSALEELRCVGCGGVRVDMGGAGVDMGGVRVDMGGVGVDMGGVGVDMGGVGVDMGGVRVDMGGVRVDMGGDSL